MSTLPNHLYELLPAVYRMRDAELGGPLEELMGVIGEQVEVVEEDISGLYENWFVETCQDWVVPYIGDLVGYRPVHEAGEPTGGPRHRQLDKVLIPRREVANTVRYRRRKGTLALLELLANDVAGWPARAVEFYGLLGLSQAANHPRLARGRTVDLRDGAALDRVDGPFDEAAHTPDVRRPNSGRTRGRHNIPTVGLFVWRVKARSVTQTPAYYVEEAGTNCYTFSVLGNDAPLYARPEPEPDATHIATESNVPGPIRRRAFGRRKTDYYGAGKSLEIRTGDSREPVPPESIEPADLTGWQYRPRPGQVVVDPELGRIAFHPREVPSRVWVSYHYGASADVGGGEYDRPLSRPVDPLPLDADDFRDLASLTRKLRRPPDPVSAYLRDGLSEDTRRLLEDHEGAGPPSEALGKGLLAGLNLLLWEGGLYDEERFDGIELPVAILRLLEQDPRGWGLARLNRLLLEHAYPDEVARGLALYRVGRTQELKAINDALRRWREEEPRHAVVEITDSGVYVEQISVSLARGQTLQLRAANRTRPVIRLLDWHTDLPDALSVDGGPGSRFTLDGLLVTGRGVQFGGELAGATIRHSTLVPGWAIRHDCQPRRPAEPSLQLFNTPHVCVNVERSIVGSIQFNQDEVRTDPIRILISDSVIDATSPTREALGAPGWPVAHARLTVERSTVIGAVQAHAIDLAENSIFEGAVKVARRQQGCLRFCYVRPGSRTPDRYNCQPDLAVRAVEEGPGTPGADEAAALQRALQRARDRVEPRFDSVRYGTPAYCRLARTCPEEIKGGADDESEMGAFHDLFQPQREANLRARLDEYTPAGTDAGIIFAS